MYRVISNYNSQILCTLISNHPVSRTTCRGVARHNRPTIWAGHRCHNRPTTSPKPHFLTYGPEARRSIYKSKVTAEPFSCILPVFFPFSFGTTRNDFRFRNCRVRYTKRLSDRVYQLMLPASCACQVMTRPSFTFFHASAGTWSRRSCLSRADITMATTILRSNRTLKMQLLSR